MMEQISSIPTLLPGFGANLADIIRKDARSALVSFAYSIFLMSRRISKSDKKDEYNYLLSSLLQVTANLLDVSALNMDELKRTCDEADQFLFDTEVKFYTLRNEMIEQENHVDEYKKHAIMRDALYKKSYSYNMPRLLLPATGNRGVFRPDVSPYEIATRYMYYDKLTKYLENHFTVKIVRIEPADGALISPAVFGPLYWSWIHLATAIEYTSRRKCQVEVIFQILDELLLCSTCSEHWQRVKELIRLLDFYPIDYRLLMIHNIVNARRSTPAKILNRNTLLNILHDYRAAALAALGKPQTVTRLLELVKPEQLYDKDLVTLKEYPETDIAADWVNSIMSSSNDDHET